MDVDCHPCASKQEQIVKFACREQGLGRAVEALQSEQLNSADAAAQGMGQDG